MTIYNNGVYNYWNTDGNILMFQKFYKLSGVENRFKNIIDNTNNTWQKNRSKKEIIDNTMQGKIAEDMFNDFINFNQSADAFTYLSYDTFRSDNEKKHAPIDGLLFMNQNKLIDSCINKINEDVRKSYYGKITNQTRKILTKNNVYTVEIKSSRIPDKDYESIDIEKFKKCSQQRLLVQSLRNRDIFSYPEFSRDQGDKIKNFNDYCNFIQESKPEYSNLSFEDLKSTIINYENESRCNIYTRIFLDSINTESVIGYLTGYALGTDFFTNPKIINMPRKGKSEKALYYVYPIHKSNLLINLFHDKRLWK